MSFAVARARNDTQPAPGRIVAGWPCRAPGTYDVSAMMVRWDVGAPPDKGEWFDLLAEALGEEASVYWVRFYREPGGWRFDLEHRRQTLGRDTSFEPADEAVAHRVYALLVEGGKPIDPGWRPSAPSPPAAVVRRPTRVVASEPPPVADAAPPGEALPPVPPVSEPAPHTRRKRHRKRHRPPGQQSLSETPPPVSEAETEPVEPAPATPVAPVLEPVPPSEAPGSTPRPPRWRGLGPAIAYSSAVLLVAFAGWLYYRAGLRPPPASPPAPSPSATASQETLAAKERLKELEAVVAQLRQERAQGPPGRRPAPPAPIAATSQTSRPQATRPSPTPAPTPVTTTAAVPAPLDPSAAADLPVATLPVPVLTAPAEPPPTAPPVQPGALVDATDPGLTPPVLVSQPRSRYPPLAQARRLSGTVSLRALVDETGAVVDASLIRASPRGLGFEDAAMSLVRMRVYRPATKQGVRVRVWLPITVEFQFSSR